MNHDGEERAMEVKRRINFRVFYRMRYEMNGGSHCSFAHGTKRRGVAAGGGRGAGGVAAGLRINEGDVETEECR